jgi:hypothetical protein
MRCNRDLLFATSESGAAVGHIVVTTVDLE